MSSSRGPLSDLRVLDLSRLIPGPYCTLILSDLGARVDKLEDPHVGDYLRVASFGGSGPGGLSGRFVALNRDKRSLCLDLKRPEGRQALLRLVPHYDVVVETFRPGVLDRLGVGWAELSARHPSLVMLSISGYGQSGPYAQRAGHDINYVSVGGILGRNGPSGAAPVIPGVQIGDIAGGALWGAVGILAALLEARRTGRGTHVDVAMCEGALSFLLPDLGQLMAAGHLPERGEDVLTGGVACYGVYQTRDGKHLSVGPLEPKFWAAFNAVLGRPFDASELVAPRPEQERIRAEVAAILRTRTRDEWEAAFAGLDVCVEPVLEAGELPDHPQHAARNVFFRIGEFAQTRTPLAPRDDVGGAHLPPPQHGEHSREVLRDGGFSDEEIEALRGAGVTR